MEFTTNIDREFMNSLERQDDLQPGGFASTYLFESGAPNNRTEAIVVNAPV